MSISHERIVEACRPIFEGVKFHDAKTRHFRRFITGYQIWHILEENDNPLCTDIKKEYGIAEGKDGGKVNGPIKKNGNIVDGPVKRICQALGNCSDIETQYLDTKDIKFKSIKPSGQDCGLFRLRI